MQAFFWPQARAHLRCIRDRSRVNWEEFVCCQVRANETYSEAKRQSSHKNKDILMLSLMPSPLISGGQQLRLRFPA